MFTTAVRTAMAVLALVAVLASSAAAQATSSPNGGNIALNASFDIPTAYLFRGLLQDDTGFIMWPAADAFVRRGAQLGFGVEDMQRALNRALRDRRSG